MVEVFELDMATFEGSVCLTVSSMEVSSGTVNGIAMFAMFDS